jgi:hypothetical protein
MHIKLSITECVQSHHFCSLIFYCSTFTVVCVAPTSLSLSMAGEADQNPPVAIEGTTSDNKSDFEMESDASATSSSTTVVVTPRVTENLN